MKKTSKKLKLEKVVTSKRFRYFCDACTNIAFWSKSARAGLSKVCRQCGKAFTTQEKNYIAE